MKCFKVNNGVKANMRILFQRKKPMRNAKLYRLRISIVLAIRCISLIHFNCTSLCSLQQNFNALLTLITLNLRAENFQSIQPFLKRKALCRNRTLTFSLPNNGKKKIVIGPCMYEQLMDHAT